MVCEVLSISVAWGSRLTSRSTGSHKARRPQERQQCPSSKQRRGKPQVRKAVFESTKKKEVGVSDLTLISKISNEAINDNLKKRFENAEIYVCWGSTLLQRS